MNFLCTDFKSYFFTFFIFNTIIFLISLLLGTIDFSVGFGFGLFAIFSILRYRTDVIPVKEASYLFVLMSLPFINALFMAEIGLYELLFINIFMIVMTYVIENDVLISFESVKTIKYEKIELIKPENHILLLEDLKERTGLNIERYEIGKIDFLRDTADITVYYKNSNWVEPLCAAAERFLRIGSEEVFWGLSKQAQTL